MTHNISDSPHPCSPTYKEVQRNVLLHTHTITAKDHNCGHSLSPPPAWSQGSGIHTKASMFASNHMAAHESEGPRSLRAPGKGREQSVDLVAQKRQRLLSDIDTYTYTDTHTDTSQLPQLKRGEGAAVSLGNEAEASQTGNSQPLGRRKGPGHLGTPSRSQSRQFFHWPSWPGCPLADVWPFSGELLQLHHPPPPFYSFRKPGELRSAALWKKK